MEIGVELCWMVLFVSPLFFANPQDGCSMGTAESAEMRTLCYESGVGSVSNLYRGVEVEKSPQLWLSGSAGLYFFNQRLRFREFRNCYETGGAVET